MVTTTGLNYTNRKGEQYAYTGIYLLSRAKRQAKDLRLNLSAICSEAVVAAVEEAGRGGA